MAEGYLASATAGEAGDKGVVGSEELYRRPLEHLD
jgi:hypothetical protein